MEAVDDPIVSQAIEWLVLLRSGAASDVDAQAFAGWRRADPRHDAACRRIENVLGGLAQCRSAPDAARQALQCKRRTLKLLAGGGVVVATGALLQRNGMMNGFFSDFSTATAQREAVTLSDNSRITLNARTRLDRTARGVNLLRGEVLVQRAADTTFSVTIPEGVIVASAARFAVRKADGFSRFAALEGEARFDPVAGTPMFLHAGEVVLLRSGGGEHLSGISADAETAWLNGFLQVSDRPLQEVVAALADYRAGFMHVAKDVADLRVSGLFPLDDTDQALRALGTALPIRIIFNTDYLVRIVAA